MQKTGGSTKVHICLTVRRRYPWELAALEVHTVWGAYNPNTVSANSMDKLSRISDDVLDKKTEYNNSDVEENQNPLKKGQTIDFEGIVAKQMQQGQNRAARIMSKGLTPEEEKTAEVVQMPAAQMETADVEVADMDEMTNAGDEVENNVQSMQNPSMQMQRAIQAYEMFMTA